MKLAAIYNVFDGLELLKGSIECIRDSVDVVIIVAQEKSNFGEMDNFVYPYCNYLKSLGLVDHVIKYNPYGGNSRQKETQKRQIGIDFAKKLYCSHFLCMDCDEYYRKEEFERVSKGVKGGTVLRLKTYYKFPSLMIKNPEKYYVPFIHELQPNTTTGQHNPYPFYVDPTRKINQKAVKLIDGVFMHHFSYIRLDIEKKIRNSTARVNLEEKAYLLTELTEAKAGSYIRLFEDYLIKVSDEFNLTEKTEEFKQTKDELQSLSQS